MDEHLIRVRTWVHRFTRSWTQDLLETIGVRAEGGADEENERNRVPGAGLGGSEKTPFHAQFARAKCEDLRIISRSRR